MKQYSKSLYIAIILAFCKHSPFMNECMYVNKRGTFTCIRCTWNILPNNLEVCVKFSIFRPFRQDSVIRSQHRDAIVISTCRVWENGIKLLACYDEENNCRSILMCHMVDFSLAYHLLRRRRNHLPRARSHRCCYVYCCRKIASRKLGITSRSWRKII